MQDLIDAEDSMSCVANIPHEAEESTCSAASNIGFSRSLCQLRDPRPFLLECIICKVVDTYCLVPLTLAACRRLADKLTAASTSSHDDIDMALELAAHSLISCLDRLGFVPARSRGALKPFFHVTHVADDILAD